MNDRSTLNEGFYKELLYLCGLCESKGLIERVAPKDRKEGMLIENSITALFEKKQVVDAKAQFEIALDLCLTWINRVLFLKLLEGQIQRFHQGDKTFAFLNKERIPDYHALERLFFQVLAVQEDERAQTESLIALAKNVPHLNSSLFEETDTEKTYFSLSALDNLELPLFSRTVLKDTRGSKRAGKMNALEYLFAFLDAYDFSSAPGEKLRDTNKAIINALVLGLIFEKINGYKDGSFFTPGFITSSICRETLRPAVVAKFNAAKGWHCADFSELYNALALEQFPLAESNAILDTLTVCDPAVGSGHFLVSALNEIIAIKSDLNLLADNNGKRLGLWKAQVENDELVIRDDEGNPFMYKPASEESRRVQEALFCEKRRIIEHSLYGVDINANSVKICRLRLWIELLKNAYYTAESNFTRLETLPNLDYKVLAGNSLNGAAFDFHLSFPEVFRAEKNGGGFDVVLGNPPYIDHKKLKTLAAEIKHDYTVYSGTADICVCFIEKGMRICREEGILAFIISNKFFTTEYGRLAREFILRRRVDTLIDFEQCAVFGNALVSSAILIVTKTPPPQNQRFIYGRYFGKSHEEIEALFSNARANQFGRYSQNMLDSNAWSFPDKALLALRKKIESGAARLGAVEGVRIYRGITTGYNPAFLVSRETRKALLDTDRTLKRFLKPVLQGRNIRKWVYRKNDQFLILANRGNGVETHPALIEHFSRFKDGLEKRSGAKALYEFQANPSAAMLSCFTREKIIWGLTANQWAFAYDDKKHYLPSNAYMLISREVPLKYILALLNSRLMRFYFHFIGVMTAGGAFTLKHSTIAQLPVVIAAPAKQQPLIAKVSAILAATAADPQADTAALEAEIDSLVYDLFGLTPEERAVVEGAAA
jgi:hypothetical protein